MRPNNMDTDEYPVVASQIDEQARHSDSTAVHIDLAALSDRGKVRPNNEDHFLVVRFHRALQTVLTNLPVGLIPVRVRVEPEGGPAHNLGRGHRHAGVVAVG